MTSATISLMVVCALLSRKPRLGCRVNILYTCFFYDKERSYLYLVDLFVYMDQEIATLLFAKQLCNVLPNPWFR